MDSIEPQQSASIDPNGTFKTSMSLIAHLSSLSFGTTRVKLVLYGENDVQSGKHTFEETFDKVLPEATAFLSKFGNDYPSWRLKISKDAGISEVGSEL